MSESQLVYIIFLWKLEKGIAPPQQDTSLFIFQTNYHNGMILLEQNKFPTNCKKIVETNTLIHHVYNVNVSL